MPSTFSSLSFCVWIYRFFPISIMLIKKQKRKKNKFIFHHNIYLELFFFHSFYYVETRRRLLIFITKLFSFYLNEWQTVRAVRWALSSFARNSITWKIIVKEFVLLERNKKKTKTRREWIEMLKAKQCNSYFFFTNTLTNVSTGCSNTSSVIISFYFILIFFITIICYYSAFHISPHFGLKQIIIRKKWQRTIRIHALQ